MVIDQITNAILSAKSSSDFMAIFRDILRAEVDFERKQSLLKRLQEYSFSKGIELSHLSIPSEGIAKKNLKTQDRYEKFVQPAIDGAEFKTIKEYLEDIQKNFPFLRPVILKKGAFDSIAENIFMVCCDYISAEYLSSYFSEAKCVNISQFCGNYEMSDNSYFFILMFPGDFDRNQKLNEKLNSLEKIHILDQVDFVRGEFFWKTNKEYLKPHFDVAYGRPLINMALSLDQERLIREAVGGPTGFLTYKVLGGGFTGALVVEVASVGNGNARKRFVLKIDRRDKKYDSISGEYKNFQDHIENLHLDGEANLTAQKYISGDFEAIKYPFASVNSMKESTSFGSFFCDQNTTLEKIYRVINLIFKSSLMKNWTNTTHVKRVTGFDAFEKLDWRINKFERINEFVKKYQYQNDLNLESLSNIFSTECEVVFSVAHGDLHSENIQIDIDLERVFFIDFGRTGLYPLGVDFAALECSIRFKLLEHAYQLDQFKKLDDLYFLNFATISKIENPDEIYKVQYAVSIIRENYINSFPVRYRNAAERQYFLTMFAVGSWLVDINKKNLNRPYIWSILHRISSIIS